MDASKPSLDFQDFGYRLPASSVPVSVNNRPSVGSPSDDDDTFVKWPGSHSDQEQLLGGVRGGADPPNGVGVRRDRSSYFSFSYYQSFFDVDTRDIITRLGGAVMPLPQYFHKSFLEEHVRVNPDLYGPFWICVTLVFSVAIAGNITNYIHHQGNYVWTYDFHKVSLAATMVILYCVVLPFLLYMFLWSRQLAARISLIELFCLYGYSLAIFVPVSVSIFRMQLPLVPLWRRVFASRHAFHHLHVLFSTSIQVLWTLNILFLQLIILFIAVCISGYVLSTSIYHAIRSDNTNMALSVAAVSFGLQFLMAALLMLSFFRHPAASAIAPPDMHSVVPNLADGAGQAAH